MAENEISSKSIKELSKSISDAIKGTISNSNNSTATPTTKEADAAAEKKSKLDAMINKIAQENLKNNLRMQQVQKDILDNNEKLLKIQQLNKKEEEQRVALLQKQKQLNEAREKSAVKLNAEQRKTRRELVKKLAEEVKLEHDKLNITLKIIESEKEYNEEVEKEISNNTKLKEQAEQRLKEDEKRAKKEAKRKEFSDFKEKKKEEFKEKANRTLDRASESIFDFAKNTFNQLLNQDSVMSKLSANYSFTKEESGVFKQNILDASVSTVALGVTTEDLVKMQSSYTDELGRSVLLTANNMANLAEMGVAIGIGSEGAAKMAADMEVFGLSTDSTVDSMQDLATLSKKNGMSTSAMAGKFQANLKVANSYTFKNGIKGVQEMTVFSSKLRINMASIAGFADKISNPEGAITAAASLQVLGGSFAQMADPMKLMNDGITDLEGLTKSYDKMLDGVAKVNKETGEVTINGYDRIRMKAAAEAMGVSIDEMMETARTKGKRQAIESSFSMNVSDEDKNLIASIAQFQAGKDGGKGEYKVNIGGKAKSVAELSKEDIAKLQPKDDSANLKTVAENTLGITDILKNGLATLAQALMTEIFPAIQRVSEMLLDFGRSIGVFGEKGETADGRAKRSDKMANTAKGAMWGSIIGGVAGGIAGAFTMTPFGVIAGAKAGMVGGAALGGMIGNASADDAIVSDGKITNLNSADQVFALKPGGAIVNAITGKQNAENSFGKSVLEGSTGSNYAISPTNNAKDTYGGVANRPSGTYGGSSTSGSGGSMTLRVEGTINLAGGGSTTKIAASELIKDKQFLRELTRIIGNQTNRDKNGGKYTGKFGNNSL